MLLDIFLSFKWNDFIDILVISFIVHRLFLLFRGTTAFQIISGLLFLWLLQAVAQKIGLVLTSWFFQGLGAIAVLVIVIIFRNEIREILIQTNPIRIFLGRPYYTPKISVNMIVKAVFNLANKKTGALIVLKNHDKLDDYVQEGIELDSKFNSQIMESIFISQSPVHDGAAIIIKNRIAKVGVFLPLTQKTGLPQHFGTRHRAAIGLTEVCDAIVIAVSEERGEVSLINKGNVESIDKPQQLKTMLATFLSKDYTQPGQKDKTLALRSHINGLLLTFLIVLTFWGLYSGKQFSLINVSTPIVFRNIPENLELIKTSAEKVEIQITGRRRLVSALNKDQVGAFINLKDTVGGKHELMLTPENITLPLGLDVVRVTPPTLNLIFEERIDKKLMIKPRLTGLLPPGYKIEKVSVQPEFVTVNGNVTALKKTSNIFTEPIDLEKIKLQVGEQTFNVALIISPAPLNLISGQEKIAKVSMRLEYKKTASEKSEKTTGIYHKVKKGETLWLISKKYKISVEKLRNLNKLSLKESIYPDQIIILKK